MTEMTDDSFIFAYIIYKPSTLYYNSYKIKDTQNTSKKITVICHFCHR